MSKCSRCTGLLVESYDVTAGERYRYCVNCGARPDIERRYPDGHNPAIPFPCRKCKKYPCAIVKYPNKGEIITPLCQFCRVEYLAYRKIRNRELQEERAAKL